MGISRSTYYAVPQDSTSSALKRESDAALRSAIENVVAEWSAYGYRRVTHELRRRGIVANHKRVARIMREEALTPRRMRRFLATTDSNHAEPIYPNLALGFRPSGPNQLWVADITYIRLRSGFVYLAVLLDAWSRRVVGYAVGNTLVVRLTLAALNAAVEDRNPQPGLIHHSDRGAQYAAKPYRDRLGELAIRGSMSRKANPYDNALAESFMKTLKHEEVLAFNYDTIDDVKRRLPRFIDEIYNARRLHSALSYMPPDEFELRNAR
jgi:putative transposase